MSLARCKIQGCNSALIISLMRSPFRSNGRRAPEMLVSRCGQGHYDMIMGVLLEPEVVQQEDEDDYDELAF